jgi:alpha/beta superfamily hydrolase
MAALTTRSWAQTSTTNLQFDPQAYTELTTSIATKDGEKTVVYRFYKAIPYVANPVDVAYQCLNISVPVSIDGVSVNAEGAPILLANSVGGYMPSTVAEATSVDESPRTGLPGGAGMLGMPAGAGQPGEVQSGGNAMQNRGERVSNAKLALAGGYVVVEPGARGRTLTDSSGTFYGVAPAAIVDLKAAVRFLRANKERVPGNTDWIVSSGTSAGGALSALLGASGDSELYADALAELGAADASDAIFATGAWCPITDLEHADMAYEWNWGPNPVQSGELVDQTLSNELAGAFPAHQAALGLRGKSNFGILSADSYGDYLVQTYLVPAATAFLGALSEADRSAYLAANSAIGWDDGKASFTWDSFVAHVGTRKKSLPAFDAFDLSTGENNLFGLDKTKARHFTTFSLRHASDDQSAELDADLPNKLAQMNPMPFLSEANPSRSKHWWIRVGASDTDTSLTIVGNLAAAAENLGDDVNAAMYWDAGHGANEDADAFIRWIGETTGYKAP